MEETASVLHLPTAMAPPGPRPPARLEQTGLEPEFVKDLILKLIRFSSRLSAAKIAAALCLPYGLIAPLLRELRAEYTVDVAGASASFEAGFEYVITTRGRDRCREALQACGYVGPAPVTLDDYHLVVHDQGTRNRHALEPHDVEAALAHLVMPAELKERIGSALYAGRSLFLFGDPGNGKTSIAEALARLPGEVFVPHAVLAEPGGVVQVFDPSCHEPVPGEEHLRHDRRWVRCRAPFVAVGGEMTLAQMNLTWDESGGIYQASLPMRAAGGSLLVDDFGRQAEPPRTLLNRWIVPLEKGVDYLSLRSGKKIEVPFDVYTVFSTNLGLDSLCEEAFMRRIGNKIEIADPTIEDYVEILRRVCADHGVAFLPDGVRHLLNAHYWDAQRGEFARPLRACHPRDIIDHLVSLANYRRRRPALEPDLIDAACRAVFVRSPGAAAPHRPEWNHYPPAGEH